MEIRDLMNMSRLFVLFYYNDMGIDRKYLSILGLWSRVLKGRVWFLMCSSALEKIMCFIGWIMKIFRR